MQGLNLRKAIGHLQSAYHYDFILVEAGASTTLPCYSETHILSKRMAPAIDFICDGNPIDTLYLSVFEGDLMVGAEGEANYIGHPFLHFDWLLSQYNLVHVSEPETVLYNFNGVCRKTFWRKKTAKELAKLREKSLGLRQVNPCSDSWRQWQQKSGYEEMRDNESEKQKREKKPEHASRSIDFSRKDYPWLSDKMFANRKPKV